MAGRRLDHTASLTAQVNAAQRAAETMQPAGRRLLDDPYSRHFVCHPALRALLAHRLPAGVALRAFDYLWGGLHAHIVLRVRYTDDVCAAAIDDGIDQVVLLGAGFDTTSLRIAGSAVRIFEVDAPATQGDKRSLTEQIWQSRRRSETVWVPCDFEQNELQERLISSGFDPVRRCVVIWLGVTMYLTAAAIDKTLADLGVLCASGSRLVVDYMDADVMTTDPRWKSARRVNRFVARRGEPYRNGFTAAGLDALLGAHGFTPHEHATVPALLQRYDPNGARRLADDDWLAIAQYTRNEGYDKQTRYPGGSICAAVPGGVGGAQRGTP